MGQLQEVHAEITELGYQILFISPDRPEKIRELQAKNKFSHTILSDSKMKAAQAFGIAWKADAETLKVLDGYGIDVEAASGETHHLLPVPSVFILDREGAIEFEYVNPQYHIRIPPGVLLAAAKALAE